LSGQQTTAGATAEMLPISWMNQPPITRWLTLFFASMERTGHKESRQQHEAELKQSFIGRVTKEIICVKQNIKPQYSFERLHLQPLLSCTFQ
jgi:hypothetical protein